MSQTSHLLTGGLESLCAFAVAVGALRPSRGVYGWGSSATSAALAGAAVLRCRGVLDHPAYAGGAERLERVERKDLLHLTERGAKGTGENLKAGQALLQLGDLDRKLRRARVEGGEVDLQFIRSRGEAGDLVGDLALECCAGAAKPQVSPERAEGRDRGDQGPRGSGSVKR